VHGREIVTPVNKNVRPRVPKPTQKPEQLIESLKATLRQAYRTVAKANRRSHVANKLYDKRAEYRSFEIGSYVYLFNPARKPGLSKKFFSVWSGPYMVTAKLLDLNYEIVGQKGRKFVVHLNRLKACQSNARCGPTQALKRPRRPRKKRQ
jgi:hypothetical protein